MNWRQDGSCIMPLTLTTCCTVTHVLLMTMCCELYLFISALFPVRKFTGKTVMFMKSVKRV